MGSTHRFFLNLLQFQVDFFKNNFKIDFLDIILNDDIKWIAFHGGYDFAYFLHMVYGTKIPETPD